MARRNNDDAKCNIKIMVAFPNLFYGGCFLGKHFADAFDLRADSL
jgi:hypothetical protein